MNILTLRIIAQVKGRKIIIGEILHKNNKVFIATLALSSILYITPSSHQNIAAKIAKLRPINIFFLEDTLKSNRITIPILRDIRNSILIGIGAPKNTAKANGNAKNPNKASTTMKENFLRKYIMKENFLRKYISNSHANIYVKLRGKY